MSASTPVSAEPVTLALDALHRSLGAKMAPFAGFMMPIQYPTGLRSEHLHTRAAAGLFDVSHMGQLRLRPRDGHTATLLASIEQALPVDCSDWPVGEQRYSVLLNDQGGIEDDLMVLRWDEANGPAFRIVVNAAHRAADLKALTRLCPDLDIEFVDAALIALQGPAAESVLAKLDPRAREVDFMQAVELTLDGTRCLATRSGYTGEDGYEISIPPAHAESVVRQLLAHPSVRPIGLGARDTLRLEAGLPLHGNDIGPDVSPIEAGLLFAIARSRRAGGTQEGHFPGAGPILEQLQRGAHRKRIALIGQDTVPVRAGAEIVDATTGARVGVVTSGTVSPTLGQPVMLATVNCEALAAVGAQGLRAVVRQHQIPVIEAKLPFVPKRYKRRATG
ncbi:MAG: glycine cleavage system protein [Pseudomonadota bacterium]|jgi:aminomethyltransferase